MKNRPTGLATNLKKIVNAGQEHLKKVGPARFR